MRKRETGCEGRDVECIFGGRLELTGENLDESEIYRYVTKPGMLPRCTRNLFYLSIEDRMYSVDIEVTKARTHVPSETTTRRTREDSLRPVTGA